MSRRFGPESNRYAAVASPRSRWYSSRHWPMSVGLLGEWIPARYDGAAVPEAVYRAVEPPPDRSGAGGKRQVACELHAAAARDRDFLDGRRVGTRSRRGA